MSDRCLQTEFTVLLAKQLYQSLLPWASFCFFGILERTWNRRINPFSLSPPSVQTIRVYIFTEQRTTKSARRERDTYNFTTLVFGDPRALQPNHAKECRKGNDGIVLMFVVNRNPGCTYYFAIVCLFMELPCFWTYLTACI